MVALTMRPVCGPIAAQPVATRGRVRRIVVPACLSGRHYAPPFTQVHRWRGKPQDPDHRPIAMPGQREKSALYNAVLGMSTASGIELVRPLGRKNQRPASNLLFGLSPTGVPWR